MNVMNVQEINDHLLNGHYDARGLFPKVEQLQRMPVVFLPQFGLDQLPTEPGIILVRGGRQLGKVLGWKLS